MLWCQHLPGAHLSICSLSTHLATIPTTVHLTASIRVSSIYHPPIYTGIHPPTHLSSTYPSIIIHPPTHLPTHLYTHSSIYPPTHPSIIHPSTHLSTPVIHLPFQPCHSPIHHNNDPPPHSLIHHLPILPLTHPPSIHSPTQPTTSPSIHLLTHPSIHSPTFLLTCLPSFHPFTISHLSS